MTCGNLLVIIIVSAIVRDLPAWKWLKYSLLPTMLAIIIYRVQMVVTSSVENGSPSLLGWILQELSAISTAASAGRANNVIEYYVQDILGFVLLLNAIELTRFLLRLNRREVKSAVGNYLFSLTKGLPPIKRRLRDEAMKLEASLEHSLRPNGWIGDEAPIKSLPMQGKSSSEIMEQLRKFTDAEEDKWRDGYVSGAVYGGEKELLHLMGEASALYNLSNPLHPDLFPSVMKFEAEICSMVASLVKGSCEEEVVGALTSGGTESIILAAKTHRDYYRAEKGIRQPEIVACLSAHAAIMKACDLMGIRLVLVPMDPRTYQVDIRAMEKAITANTILLYASAPSFSQGVIDPISQISSLGVKYGIGVHVDCCLGGFILPFAKKYKLLPDLPDFDFSLPGVTSMSIDTHKYGYAAKGTSVVVYRNKALRRYQYFCFSNWPGGLYVTPTLAGSRPGALSAACWSALVHVGEEGYRTRALQILQTTQLIAKGIIDCIPALELQGKVQAMIVCVGTAREDLNIYDIGDRMTAKGWSLNSLQNPPAIHLCVTLRHVQRHEKFLSDLKEATEEVLEEARKAASSGKKAAASKKGNAAIYGMASTLPNGPIDEMLRTYTDVVLKI